jgi:stage II sporulation protein D
MVRLARLGRAGLSLLGSIVLATVPAAACAATPAAPAVRVLLIEAEGPVRVTHGARRVELTPVDGGIRVDGEAVGRVWRAPRSPRSFAYQVAGRRVRGDLEVRRVSGGIRVINRVGLEDYVTGTLGREVYPGWHPEMLKAQAVVTRTYALHEVARNAANDFDVGAGTSSQVYGGIDAETPSVRKAARTTRGEYLAYRREPILAVFHSASGGRTATAEEVWGEPIPYLVSIEVENEEDSPDTYWRASVSRTTLGPALAPVGIQVGSIREIRVVERSASGRASRVHVRGTKGTQAVAARALRTALGASVIRSTLFEIRPSADGFIFVGSGHGHGVGMSQWGAQAMAESGADYREILERFYPGTTLREGAARSGKTVKEGAAR